MRQYLPYATVVLICLLYVMTAVIDIEAGKKPLAKIISDGTLAFIFGISLTMILSDMGLSSGEREECVKKARGRHEGEVERVAPYIDELDEWCGEQNRRNYKVQRAKLLSKVGLAYAQCFGDDAVAIPYDPDVRHRKGEPLRRFLHRRRLERKRGRIYEKCVDLQLKEISSGELTSEGGNPNDPYNLGRSKAVYMNQTAVRGAVSKIAVAVIAGYYGATLVHEFSWGKLIWLAMQAGMFLALAVVKMYASHEYMVTEFRARLEKKTLLLVKFRYDRKKTETDGWLVEDMKKNGVREGMPSEAELSAAGNNEKKEGDTYERERTTEEKG
jgi:hypothetical protein